MNIGDKFVVNIEKMSNLGKGIAKIDGQVVFVDCCCPDDVLNVEISKVSKTYANAKIIDILKPSKYRVKPFCAMQYVCGACQFQFIDYRCQLEIKRQIVKDTLLSIAGIDFDVPLTVPSPINLEYRHKIQYPISQTKVSKRLLAGYYKPQSHDIVNIKYCPIQPRICDNIIDFIRENAPKHDICGYNEQNHCGALKHVVLRVSSVSGKVLVTLVINTEKLTKNVEIFSKKIFEEFNDVVGVCINFNPKHTNVILSDKTVCAAGQDFVEEKVLDKIFKIGADTFFQVNPKSAENIFNYVKNEVQQSDNPAILDAYAGIATFGILVSNVSKEVVSVESNKSAIEKAKEVLTLNNIDNVELYAEDTTKYLQKTNRQFDITILDPPRKGCTKESLDEILKHTKEKIIYVSCNPATLARDLKYLTEKGCFLKSIQPFDMFCHTYHVETVALMEM